MPRSSDCPKAYQTFRRWLVFLGLLLFGLFLTWEAGLLTALLETDRSHLSVLILVAFAAATVHAGWRARSLGREICMAQQLRARMRDAAVERLAPAQADALADGSSYAHEHLGFLLQKASEGGAPPPQELLLERLNMQVRSGHESGWFVADLMLKLGLLGTVIGFIFMLASVTGLQQVDIQALQQLLTSMSDGMRVALYTTLAGLSAGMLLGLQYQLLDRASDQLLAIIIELSEVHLPQYLERLSAATRD